MQGFHDISAGAVGLSEWRGHPDDDAAHAMILGWLHEYAEVGYLGPQDLLSPQMKGNLGEFIAYQVGKSFVYSDVAIAPTAGDGNPLSRHPSPGIDIIWFHIGDTVDHDWVALQEVKTTNQDLQLADRLITDYEKLFGRDPHFTLQTRLYNLKIKLRQFGRTDVAWRLDELAGPEPRLTRGVRLIPTFLHDVRIDSKSKMVVVRQALLHKGWPAGVVQSWNIALGDFDERLTRLARGQL